MRSGNAILVPGLRSCAILLLSKKTYKGLDQPREESSMKAAGPQPSRRRQTVGLVLGRLVRLRAGASVRAQLALSQRFEWLIREANDSILLLDAGGRILEANSQAVAQYGYTEAEFKGMNIMDMRPPEARDTAQAQFAQMKSIGALRFETTHQRKDGSMVTVEVSARSFASPDGPRISSLIRDISERVLRDRELRRMTALYVALGQVSQAIVQSPSRQVLLDRICRVMVEAGGFAMAWVGWDDPVTHRVAAVARYGDDLGMLDRVCLLYTSDAADE